MATTTSTKSSAASKKTTTATKEEVTKKEEPIIPKEIDVNQLIPVKNGFFGRLVYISARTKEEFEWEEEGDIQEIELRELRSAKSSAKKFFSNNWFLFDEEYDWVIDYLGVRKFYKNAINVEDLEHILKKSPAEIKKAIGALTPGQRSSLLYKVRDMVASNEIDSRKAVSTLEEAFGVELIEK